MLVLTRLIGEEIVIGENIRVKVVAVKGHRVRLGITAPLSVIVRREELLIQAHKPTVAPIIRPCRNAST
jgi:carbon storage regulator